MNSAEWFGLCYSKVPEASLLVSFKGRILAGNRAAHILLHRDAGLVGANLPDLVRDPAEKVSSLLTRWQRSPDLLPGALSFISTSGGEMPCRLEGGVFCSSPQEKLLLLRLFLKEDAVRHFRVLNQRIEQLASELLERRRVEAKLHAQQELLRATLASIGDGVIATDVHGRISFMNGVAQALTGWAEHECVGKPLEEIFRITNESTGLTVENPVSKVLRYGHVVGLAIHTELKAKDGRLLPIDDTASPIRDVEGRLCGVVLVFRDVTDRRNAEREIRTSMDALQMRERELTRAIEDLNQFAFAASHDLQEPLRMISSYSQLLMQTCEAPQKAEAAVCVEFITQGTRRMRALLADLLAYTQVNVAENAIPDVVDLNAVFAIAVENCKTAIEGSGAEVTADPLPFVPGNQSHFIQLLQNLIANGVKYRSELPPRIHVSAVRADGAWQLSVSDNGIGIDPEFHQTIFGVFKRLHGREIPGTGIGLAICKRVVDRMGGRIWVQSRVNEGTTIHCTIPLGAKGEASE